MKRWKIENVAGLHAHILEEGELETPVMLACPNIKLATDIVEKHNAAVDEAYEKGKLDGQGGVQEEE